MGRYLGKKIMDILDDESIDYIERSRTIHLECPSCERSDKFSVLKENGSCVCYHGSCDFGIQWFEFALQKLANIPLKEARQRLYGRKEDKPASEEMSVSFDRGTTKKKQEEDLPISWPPILVNHKGIEQSLDIKHTDASDGVKYMKTRGIPVEMLNYYNIRYFPDSRRIAFPVIEGGLCYGWQARSIDKNPYLKVMSNTGLRKNLKVMFADNLINSKHAIICEGPIDAIKFYLVGGAVCTMGKAISQQQIDFIIKSKVEKIYIAMDDDAAEEMNELKKVLQKTGLPIYKIEVPKSCRDRCERVGKKADFGECTFRECEAAFSEARPLDQTYILYHLK